MKARTAVIIGAIILLVAGVAVWIHHGRQKPASPFRVHSIQIDHSPGSIATEQAVNYLHQLRISGRLPGFKENEPCLVLMPRFPVNLAKYPVSLELQARKHNVAGPFPYHFTLIKTSAASDWQLQRAWLADADGKVAEEYSVQ